MPQLWERPVIGEGTDVLIILRTFAALTTVLTAALVAANLNARVTVSFVIFIAACIVVDDRQLD